MKHGKRINLSNGYMCQISIKGMLESERAQEMSIQIKPLTFRRGGGANGEEAGLFEFFVQCCRSHRDSTN